MNTGWEPFRGVRLRGGVAAWVLLAHGLALLLPLWLVAVVGSRFEFVAVRTDYPVLFYAAAGLMMAASAFEIAQNSFDGWYLVPGCGSADGKSFCDFLFYQMLVAAQATVIAACNGGQGWLMVSVAVLVLTYPWFYTRRRLGVLPLAVLGAGSTLAAWFAFGDPLIFLQLAVAPLTGVLFAALLRSRAQWLHGFTTLAAASNVVVLAVAISSVADGEPSPWLHTVIMAAVLAAVAAAIPRLTRGVSATPVTE